MPPKQGKAERQQNAANARAKSAQNRHDSERTLGELEPSSYDEALETIKCLEGKLSDEQSQSAAFEIALQNEREKGSQLKEDLERKLADEQSQSAALEIALQNEREKVSQLKEDLEKEKLKYQELYRTLHVERQAKKHGIKKKEMLEDQINLLKSAALEDSKNHKEIFSSANHAVESLLRLEKENAGLRSDLSLCLEQMTRRAQSCSLELNTLRKELRKSKKQTYRLLGLIPHNHKPRERKRNRFDTIEK